MLHFQRSPPHHSAGEWVGCTLMVIFKHNITCYLARVVDAMLNVVLQVHHHHILKVGWYHKHVI